MNDPESEDELPDFEKTRPSPMCEGSPTCDLDVEVMFFRTGKKMCLQHAAWEVAQLSVQDERDTDPAPPDAPTIPPPPSDG